jgi:hypothetical protein
MEREKLVAAVKSYMKTKHKIDLREKQKLSEFEELKEALGDKEKLAKMNEQFTVIMRSKFKDLEQEYMSKLGRSSTLETIVTSIENALPKDEAMAEEYLDEKKKKDEEADEETPKSKKAKTKDAEAELKESKDDDSEEEEENSDAVADEDDDDDDDEEKPKKKKKVEEDYDEEELDRATLSEDFKEKATFLFETVLNEKVKKKVEKEKEKLEQKYDENLKEAMEDHASQLNEELESLTEKIDEYLTYVAEEWMSENEIAVEKGIRSEITEQFITGLKDLFKENYIEVPEGKEDFVVSLEEKNDELVEQVNVHLKRNMNLKKQLQEEKRRNILNENASELTLAEKEQLKSLAESVDFENEGEFEKKILILKEHYFSGETVSKVAKKTEEDMIENEKYESSTLVEEYYEQPAQAATAIDVYKQAISKHRF